MTQRTGRHAAYMIEQAREIAARGTLSYHDALDAVARDNGFGSWQGASALLDRDRIRPHPEGASGFIHDTSASLALMMGANDLTRRRDSLVTAIVRPVVVGLARRVGIGRSMTATIVTFYAAAASILWLTLSFVLMTTHHPLGSYADDIPRVLPILLVADLWLASRWLLSNRDPLRTVCRTIRVNALTAVAFRTIIAAMLWMPLTGIDLRAMQIVHFVAIATAGPFWLLAMHVDVVAAEASDVE